MGYTPEAARLDSVIDAVNRVSYTIAKVNAGKKRVRTPEPVPRPSQSNTAKPTDLEDVGRFFAS